MTFTCYYFYTCLSHYSCPYKNTYIESILHITDIKVDGSWLEWSDWSECTTTCGGGIQTRDRKCDGPFHNGKPCAGNTTDQQECNLNPCKCE